MIQLRRLNTEDSGSKVMSGLIGIPRRYQKEETEATTRYPTAQQRAVSAPRDLDKFNTSRENLNKHCVEDVFERPSRGLYVLHNSRPSEL